MKKFLNLTVILLLALTLLWGCGANQDESGKPEDVTFYYFLDRGTVLEPDASGVYTLNFFVNGEKKTYKSSNQVMVEELFFQDFVGLTLEGDTVTGFTRMADLPYKRVAQDYFIQSMGGNKIKLSGPENYEFLNLLVEISENTPIYNVSTQSTDYSPNAVPLKNDSFSAVADQDGNLIACFITTRPAVVHEGKQFCQHCESDVEWYDWIATNKLPVSNGHYILTEDVKLAATAVVTSGAICVDLNGKTVSQSTFGEKVYQVAGSSQLSVMDSVGSGKIVPNSIEGSSGSGMGIYVNGDEAVFNLHGGTIDATECSASFGNAIYINAGTINIYDGTILGGDSYGAGGCAISGKGNMNIYGGKIVGGKLIEAQYHLPIGGAAIRVLGVCTIYGGEIIGGETDMNGGAIRICGDAFGGAKLVLKGGSITGGKASVGGGIYVSSLSNLQILGDVEVTDNEGSNIYVEANAKVAIDITSLSGNADIGVTLAAGAVIEAEESANLSQYLTSDNGEKLVYLGDGKWGAK